ncbi:deubiquitinase OTUD6B [Drosophila madeirensis]|uniref:ubiquitinyl hydrolase 1 n=2 Tax=Drosophila madeirensis TaxID=30013 RepID=A0AAU9FLB5_DROMD
MKVAIMAKGGLEIFKMEPKLKEIHLEDVATRHRRERKELQAKLQAMKKNAPKNNKTKRKEFLDEMSRLENELEQRQKVELQADNSKDVSELSKNEHFAGVPTAACQPAKSKEDEEKRQEPGTQRVSKAQKRRDRKAREAREREEEIRVELQNAANDGPSIKLVELQQITAKLSGRQLALHSIASDGDCLYHAVLHQLNVNSLPGHSVQELRKETANYVRAQKDTFVSYMTHPKSGDLLNEEQFEQYCKDIDENHAWGGHIELKAMSSLLKVPIEVIQADGAPTLLGQEEFGGAPLVLCFHRHMYQLGAHYNSTVPVEI